ncbi:hypothetical protein PIB30_021559 [Stylosanthes scabra]|uniref:Uncharacterized protein n=1 Tax=Stylosanthes scabra TaxID=79078 RepID=A0ABU6S940_9FABA|nr:hypothetical protein [Stylosanthes scabra]
MVSSRVVDLFPSERDQRELQGGHQGKRLSATREQKQGKKQDRNVGTLVFGPTVGANVLGWSLGEEILLGYVLASKRADSTSKRLTELGTAGGGPARSLRRSNLEDGVTVSAVVRVRESNPYFCGMKPCSYVD